MTVPEAGVARGLYFDEFDVGAVFRHAVTRTVYQADNILFSNMTMNAQPLHIDANFSAENTRWGVPLINSFFTLALMVGISVGDTTLGTTVGNLGMTNVRFPAPLFDGDTVRVETEVLGKRLSKSNPRTGIVELQHRAYKQDGTLVGICDRQALIAVDAEGLRQVGKSSA